MLLRKLDNLIPALPLRSIAVKFRRARRYAKNMTLNQSISRIMGLWRLGFYKEEELVSWADATILKMESPSSELLELSLKGPSVCAKLQEHEFPSAEEFSFSDRFALKLYKTDLDQQESKKKFVSWVAREAMGENMETPEVGFGYQLEHRLSYDEDDPVVYFENYVHPFLEKSKERTIFLTNMFNQ